MGTIRRSIFIQAILLVGLVLGAGYVADSYLSRDLLGLGDEHSLFSSLYLFLLINLNIIIVMILVFLLIKNIVKLLLERRRNLLGSALRTRLVASFVGLTIFPALVLFVIAKGILGSLLNVWFAPQLQRSFEGAQNMGRYYREYVESVVLRDGLAVAEELSDTPSSSWLRELHATESEQSSDMGAYLMRRCKQLGLVHIAVVDASGQTVVGGGCKKGEDKQPVVPEPHATKVQEAVLHRNVLQIEQSLESEFVRAYIPLPEIREDLSAATNVANASRILIVTKWVNPEVTAELSELNNAYDDYRELAIYRRPVASGYQLVLVGGTLLTMFVAIWIGFRVSANITQPIKLLAEGTEQLARGNLSYEIPKIGDDELGTLVQSFNKMTGDLRRITEELVSRRRYMETVLASVDVGVISLDAEQNIQTCNEAAANIMRLSSPDAALGKKAQDLVPSEIYKRLQELLAEMAESGEVVTANISVPLKTGVKHVAVTVTELVDDRNNHLGAVILLDDLTELVQAQRMAAWRDVARRIAHEIKNPLTPIQLSAQRIQRRFAQRMVHEHSSDGRILEDFAILTECTNTIVDQVHNLRNLVNEFSRFARMPRTTLEPVKLNEILSGLHKMYQEAHPFLDLTITVDENLPLMQLDKDKISRALVNLIDNAIASVKMQFFGSEKAQEVGTLCGERPFVGIEAKYDADIGLVSLTVSDNGTGVKDRDRTKVFEPYFSRRKDGTGLGLAIVSSIVADHNGFVRLHDNPPRGASFVIELPV